MFRSVLLHLHDRVSRDIQVNYKIMHPGIWDKIKRYAILFYIQYLLNIVNVIMDDDYYLVFNVCR
jgi:hypothetical protein